MRPTPVKNNFKDQFYNDVMPFIYNIGAAIVIFGAMFKLLNLPGGNLMLGLGLSTEALIFVLGAFEPKPQEVDWSRVYPELAPNYKVDLANNAPKPSYSVTQKLDQCLEQASIDLSLLENLATTMRRFSENMASVPSFAGVSQVTEAYVSHVAQATQVIGELAKFNDTVADVMRSFIASSSQEKLTNYFGQIDEMAHTLTAMNGVYKKALADMESQTTHTGTLCNHLDTALQAMEVAGAQAINFKEELALLNEKVTALNAIYAKTLTAFKG